MLETLERLIFDPITENPPYGVAANRPLEITGVRTPSPEGHGVFLTDHSYPRPEMTSTFATSRDSQGEVRFGKPKLSNRKIPVKVYVSEAKGVGEVTNLATNPAGELKAKYAAGTNGEAKYDVTRELGTRSVPSLSGEYRDKHAWNGLGTEILYPGAYAITLPKAGTYVMSTFVWIPTSWDGGPVYLTTLSWTGEIETTLVKADMSRRDQWQRISVRVVVEAGDLTGELRITFNKPMPTTGPNSILYSDALQIETGSNPTPFVCGDTPGCGWTGAANESTSVRFGNGEDRKRFIRCLYDLQEKIEKLAEMGGTFKRVLPDGSTMVFDVVEASFVGNWEKRFNQGQEEFAFELTCKPGARLTPIVLTAHEEKTLPILTFTETEIPGNMSALGDLLIEDTQGVDRQFVAVALASRFLDQSANGEVFYQAEGRERLSGAGKAAGSGVPSGEVVTCTLFEEYTPYLSTRSSAGAYTSHVGAQKMFARVWLPEANKGEISIRTEYAQGDLLRWKSLDPVIFAVGELEGQWVVIDLGVVRLNQAVVGTQRWEGRISAKSTVAADVLHIDWIAPMPVEEFYGETRSLAIPSTIGSQVARDPFIQTTGALTGKTALVGGVWSGEGDADDFSVSGSPYFFAGRFPTGFDVSGAANGPLGANIGGRTGRYCRLGTGVLTSGSVECEIQVPSYLGYTDRRAVLMRYGSSTKMLMAHLDLDGFYYLRVSFGNGGTWAMIVSKILPSLTPGSTVKLLIRCAADGSGYVSLKSGETTIATESWGPTAILATGGALETGGYGVYHEVGPTPANSVWNGAHQCLFDSFTVREIGAQPVDAAMYANRDLRIRWDKTLREASDGSGAYTDVGLYQGDRLYIPPSGREGRASRISVLASRAKPKTGNDVQADDIKGTLTITPRTIEVPEPV